MADSYNKTAVKAPRKVSIMSGGGQASNVKAGSTSKGTGNLYCSRPKPVWQLDDDSFFPKAGEPFDLKNRKKNKKPVQTAVSSDDMFEGSCSVDEVDSENAGPSKSADDVDSEMAGSSESADDVDSERARPIIIASIKTVNTVLDEQYLLIDDETFVMIINDDLLETEFY